MLDLFRFLVDYQIWIYVVLGVLALIYLVRLINAARERYATIFGLEREDAQRRLNSALAVFILLVLLIAAEFTLVTFVIPEWPMVMMTPPAETPTPVDEELMITNSSAEGGLTVISTPEGSAAGSSSPVSVLSSGCIPDQLEWLEPVSGDVISGSYILEATVNVQNMAFYKWSYASVDDQQSWRDISGNDLPVIEGELGLWATTQVPNGDYVLRLTVYNLNNEELPSCDAYIRVLNEE